MKPLHELVREIFRCPECDGPLTPGCPTADAVETTLTGQCRKCETAWLFKLRIEEVSQRPVYPGQESWTADEHLAVIEDSMGITQLSPLPLKYSPAQPSSS